MTDAKQSHFRALDSLRGIAAVSVVLYHVSWLSPISTAGYVRNSYLMVDFFFVLSGFVIAFNYRERITSGISALRFMWLRIWRLYPLHFVMLLVVLGIEIVKYIVQTRTGKIEVEPAFSTNNATAFVANLFLVQSLHVLPRDSFNIPAWSISTEFYAYAVFALIATLTRRVTAAGALICGLCTVFLVYVGNKGLKYTHDFGFIRCLLGFFFGVVAFRAYERLVTNGAAVRGWVTRLLVPLSAAIVCLLAFKPGPDFDFAMPVLSALLIVSVALSPESRAVRVLTMKPFLWLGTVSYSIYMVQSAVAWTVRQAVRALVHAPQVVVPWHDAPVVGTSPLVGAWATLALIAILLLASHFTYSWIELPWRDWSKRTLQKWQTRQEALETQAI